MNLGQLRTALQARGYGTDTATTQTECINAAYREICGDHHWEWLEESVAASTVPAVGDTDFTFTNATDLLHVQALRILFPAGGPYTEQYDLAYLPSAEFRSMVFEQAYQTTPRQNGIPQYWSHREHPTAAAFMIYPSVDKAYQFSLDYIKDPADLSADGDIPLVPATYHDVIVSGALAEMGARHRDWAMADRYRARFERGLSRMKAQLGIDQQQTSQQVRKSGFFDAPERWPWRP